MPRQPFGLPHLCIDSHLCRCIVQQLCVAVFMHPCITALCGCLYASLLKTLGVHFIRHPCPFLVKGEVLSPTKILATAGGDATPSALAPHQPFQNHTIPRHTPPHLAPLPKGAGLRQGTHQFYPIFLLLRYPQHQNSLNFFCRKTEGSLLLLKISNRHCLSALPLSYRLFVLGTIAFYIFSASTGFILAALYAG